MLAEGVPAPSIEQASSQAGYPAPGAAAQRRAEPQADAQDPRRRPRRPSRPTAAAGTRTRPSAVIDRMLDEFERGRAASRAPASTSTRTASARGLWPGLRDAFPPVDEPSAIPLEDLEERMLFIEAIETVKCLDEGVIESVADANIGSILGIGFPGWTGGVLQYINGYDGGLAGFVARARELAATLRRALRAAGVAGREGRARRDVQPTRPRSRPRPRRTPSDVDHVHRRAAGTRRARSATSRRASAAPASSATR